MMVDEDGPKPRGKGFYSDPADPPLDLENLEIYLEMVQGVDEEKKEGSIWVIPVRFEVNTKVYGARFVVMLLEMMKDFKIIATEHMEISYAEFIEFIKHLISELKSKIIPTTVQV